MTRRFIFIFDASPIPPIIMQILFTQSRFTNDLSHINPQMIRLNIFTNPLIANKFLAPFFIPKLLSE